MKMLVVSQVPPPVHGSTLMTQLFLQVLNSAGIPTRLVDRRFSRTAEDIGFFSLKKVFSAFHLVFRFCSALITFRPENVVIFATTRPASFLVDWVLFEILRFSSIKPILYIHTIGYAQLANRSAAWKFLVKRTLGRASLVVSLSTVSTDDIRPFTRAPISIIPNTLPEEPADMFPEASKQEPTILYLSNLIPGKRHEDVLQVARRCWDAGIRAKFMLAGAASPEVVVNLQEFKSTAPNPELFQYLGPVAGASKWSLFNVADIFLFPSENEALPLVQLEAAACGVPIVAYNVGAVSPFLREQEAATVIDNVGDADRLAIGVLRLLRDAPLREQMGENAKKAYEKEYGREMYRERWLDALDFASRRKGDATS